MIQHFPTDDWVQFDRAHPAPTFFARPAWAQALAETYDRLIPHAVVVGNNPPVIVPAMLAKGRAGFRELLAFPLGTYTAFLDEAGNAVGSPDATRTLGELKRSFDRVSLILWPLGPQAEPNTRGGGAVHSTAAIDCADGFESALARMRGVTRRMAGQATRRGLVCRRAASHELLAYYQLLREAHDAREQHLPKFALLEAVLRHGGDDAQLWFAESDGLKVAGGIVLFGSEELFFWSAAMRREYGHLRPSNALNVALIEAACKRGVRWYNLGASEGLEGVEQFKRGLGACDHAYMEVSLRAPIYMLYEQLRARIRPAWKH